MAEHELQTNINNILAQLGYWNLHIHNYNDHQGMKRDCHGMPDNMIMQRIEQTPFFLGMGIELKSERGKLHGKQKHWQRRINSTVIRSIDEFMILRKKYDSFLDYLNNHIVSI